MTSSVDRFRGWFDKWCPQGPTRFNLADSDLRYIRLYPWIYSENARSIFLMFFSFSLVLGLFIGFSPYMRTYMEATGQGVHDQQMFSLKIMVPRLILFPFIMFIASYILGKRLDIETETRPIIYYLIVGCVLGNLFGHIIMNIYLYATVFLPNNLNYDIILAGQYFFKTFSTLFSIFVTCFSGIAFASLRNSKKATAFQSVEYDSEFKEET